jgi:hypothetical protein
MKTLIFRIITMSLMAMIGAGCSLFGEGNEEQPSYEVVLKEDNKEIRLYKSYLVAKTTVEGSFKEAQNKGFKILAGFIFGDNKAKEKISMTSPVVQKPVSSSEEISMTAPVIIAPSEESGKESRKFWTMTFSMPSKYTLETLPVPIDNRIVIQEVAPQYVASITFSGFWGEHKNTQKAQELLLWLEDKKQYEVVSSAMFAGYNPPWTLPFLRRNEMLVNLEKK